MTKTCLNKTSDLCRTLALNMNFVRLSIAELGAGTGQTDRQTVRALHNAPPLGGLHMKKCCLLNASCHATSQVAALIFKK